MAAYRCIKRLKTADGVIHEVGNVVNLEGDEAQSALRQQAVILAPVTPTPAPAQPSLEQLKQEEQALSQQIATMEHEGGPAS